MPPPIPLHLLPVGSTGQITELMGDVQQVRRLEELGFRQGVEIKMVCPGSPCIVHLDGCRLCFRHTEVAGVLVTGEDCT